MNKFQVEELKKLYKPPITSHKGQNGKLMIIDAGANIGLFSLKMFYFFPKSTIHAIEPSSDTFDVLKMNKKINNTFSWKLYDAALTRQDGEISFKNYKYLSVNN